MTTSADPSSDATLPMPAATSAPPPTTSVHALPVGHRLGEFQIERILGEGGFGIVYLALDTQLQRRVALKEYMPAALAARAQDLSVVIRSERDRSTFELGLRSFINEARILAQLDHPALVKVHRFWEERGTAYMVMPCYPGRTLKQVLRDEPALASEAWLRALLEPLLDVLGYLHSQDIYHRDVSPDNVLLLPDGRPVLLDFGAARTIIGDATQNLTAILKPGYAPVEQYAESGSSRQGAWTDIYALAALLYFVVSGKAPTPSVIRLMNDDMPSAASLGQGRFSTALLEGIDACLAVRPEQRPRDVASARRCLAEGAGLPTLAPTAVPPAGDVARVGSVAGSTAVVDVARTRIRPRWSVLTAGLAMCAVAGWWWIGQGSSSRRDEVLTPAHVERAPVVQQSPAAAAAQNLAPPPSAELPPAAPPPAAPGDGAATAPAKGLTNTTPSINPAARVPPAVPRAARSEASAPAGQCAELLQRLSLGDDNAALREQLAQLRCR